MPIANDITNLIGRTPIVRLNSLPKEFGCKADVLAKLESFNPTASVKDRIAGAMVLAEEQKGTIYPGKTVLIEPTSGNTGIALAMVAAAKGYRLILTMPDSMSVERRKMLNLLSAEIILTPAQEGMSGAIVQVEKILKKNKGAIMPQQFSNTANPEIHRTTTSEEIWYDTDGMVDVIVGGVGTGGTLTGVGEVLKSRKQNFKVVAVEPEDSSVLSGGSPGPHKIQGIGAGFVPDNLNTEIVDEVIRIANETAFTTARKMAKLEGIPIGISSGASIAASIELAQKEEMAGKLIVSILPSFAERYLSTSLFDGLTNT